MDLASILTGALAGLIVGAVIGWLAASARRPKDAATPDAERATLIERLATRDQRVAELDARLTAADGLVRSLHDQLRDSAARTSAAEQRCERIPALEGEIAERNRRIDVATGELRTQAARIAELETRLVEERNAAAEKLGLLNEARQKLTDAFQQLSTEALNASQQSFLELARNRFGELQTAEAEKHAARQEAIENLVKPLKESLLKVDEKVQALETKREGAYAGLMEQVRSLQAAQAQLQTQAGNLVKALRAPQVRGRWGEIQLKRVVELAGMVEYCDFVTQATVAAEDGKLRPDMVVRLPSGKNVVVDAKAPLAAYLEALEAPDEGVRFDRLREHAAQIRRHVDQLSGKSYWDRLEPSPEFVVLFLPGETFFSAALEQDPSLIEAGVEKRVILATPTTL
ncbi:MAG: DNA recombination protein RmuC, partial [Phycisphaerales bacterium]|nr:DNA recombination protein RmuC [Phycisphaerales bacterium]